MPCEQELAQEKVRGGAVDGIWVIRSPWLSSLSLHFLSGLILSVPSQTRGLRCPPLCLPAVSGL